METIEAIARFGLAVVHRGPMRYALVDTTTGKDISVHASKRIAMTMMWRVAGDMRRSECARAGDSSSPEKDR